MYIERIKLINFRNYENQEVSFSKEINCLYGDNAQGKTNLLEAIHICSLGKSHKMSRDSELVFFKKEGYFIEIDLIRNNRKCKIEVGGSDGKRKKIKISGKETNKRRELIGKLIVVLFSPDEMKIIKEGPQNRRRFLDILGAQLSTAYLFDLQQYQKVMEQRNTLLRQIYYNPLLEDTLDVWDQKLAQFGARIIIKREEIIKKLNEKIIDIHKEITNNQEIIKLEYKNSVIKNNTQNLQNKIQEEIKKSRRSDIKRGITQVGPHRDDILFIINEKDAEKFCSQGQQRTAVLSLKLAELGIVKDTIGENPVLLLDDVFSELDEGRRIMLAKHIRETQTFITSTDKIELINFENRVNYIYIKDGRVQE